MTEDSKSTQIDTEPIQALEKVGVGAILMAYGVLLGTTYLFSFWRTFGFDIFPYLSVQNYVTAILNRLTLLLAMPLLFVGIVFGKRIYSKYGLFRNITLNLIILYSVLFVFYQFKALSQYIQHDFHFENEINLLAISSTLFIASLVLAIRMYRTQVSLYMKVAALVLIQTAFASAAGYVDGKAIYNGAVQVYLLQNKEVCEARGLNDWVYLGKYSSQTFFLNTIDKRICITSAKDLMLISRKLRDGL